MSWLIFLLAAINTLAVVVLGLARQDWPPGFWTRRSGSVLAAILITGAVALLQALLSERGEKARRRALERQRQVETFLTPALIQMAQHAGADWETTGVQVFEVKFRRHRVRFRKEQARVAKVRLGAIPSTDVRWTKGKGVIGRCWESRQPQYEDFDKRFAPYRHFTRGQWEAAPDADRFGLTYDDFRRLRGKYGIVAAVPIITDTGVYRGCVTTDMPPGKTADREEVIRSLAATAKLVKEII